MQYGSCDVIQRSAIPAKHVTSLQATRESVTGVERGLSRGLKEVQRLNSSAP